MGGKKTHQQQQKKKHHKLLGNGLGCVAGGNVGAAEDKTLCHRAHLAADNNDVARAELLPVLGKVRLEQPRNLRNALAVRLDNAVRPHPNALHPWEPFFTLFVPFPVCVHEVTGHKGKRGGNTNSCRHRTSASVFRCTHKKPSEGNA